MPELDVSPSAAQCALPGWMRAPFLLDIGWFSYWLVFLVDLEKIPL